MVYYVEEYRIVWPNNFSQGTMSKLWFWDAISVYMLDRHLDLLRKNRFNTFVLKERDSH